MSAAIWLLTFLFARLVRPFYQPIGYGEAIAWNYDNRLRGEAVPVYITEYGLKVMRDASRRACAQSTFAINAIENRISYIAGKGFQYEVLDRHRKGATKSNLAKQTQECLDEFLNRCGWSEREQEAVLRCDRDGECFIRLFHVGDGKTEVRWIEPEHIRDQTGQRPAQFGIVSDPYDIEHILGCWVCERPWDGLTNLTYVPADEVVHIKINTDASAKRGLPTFHPVSKNLARADKLLRNMSTLAQVQATFSVIRKHKDYSAAAISAFQQSQADRTFPSEWGTNPISLQRLRPGSILDTSANTEYEFPGANIDASSLVAILQAELRAIAARLVMPEYMLTVDASNANYASTLVAEAPSIKNFERLQQHFARRFGDGRWTDTHHCSVLWRVISNAVEYGDLPREALTELEIQAEGPVIIARDRDRDTQRNKTLNEAGILSKHTWSKWEALDRDQEQKLVELEKEKEKPQPERSSPGDAEKSGKRSDLGEGKADDEANQSDDRGPCVKNENSKGYHFAHKGWPCKPDGAEQPQPAPKKRSSDEIGAEQRHLKDLLSRMDLDSARAQRIQRRLDELGLRKKFAKMREEQREKEARVAKRLGQLSGLIATLEKELKDTERSDKDRAAGAMRHQPNRNALTSLTQTLSDLYDEQTKLEADRRAFGTEWQAIDRAEEKEWANRSTQRQSTLPPAWVLKPDGSTIPFDRNIDPKVLSELVRSGARFYRMGADKKPQWLSPEDVRGGTRQELDTAVQQEFIRLMFAKEWPDVALDVLQQVLDLAAQVPLLGAPLDVLNAAISAGRGKTGDAAIRLLAILAMVGGTAALSKVIKNAALALKASDTVSASESAEFLKALKSPETAEALKKKGEQLAAAMLKRGDIKPGELVKALQKEGLSAEAAKAEVERLQKIELDPVLKHIQGEFDFEKGGGKFPTPPPTIKVPRIKGGAFHRWFNSLTPEQLRELWKNPKVRETIEKRLRHPGGLHEWLPVSRAPKFREWGITAEQIHELRTATKDVKWKVGGDHLTGVNSQTMHNEILNIVDTSKDFATYVRRLQAWADRRLVGGSAALPGGLRPK